MIDVLVADESALMRQLIAAQLARDPALRVAGAVADPHDATRIGARVILLDMEMRRVDPLAYIAQRMARAPVPIVACAAPRAAALALDALEAGAVEVVAKPSFDVPHCSQAAAHRLVRAVHAAARATPQGAPERPERLPRARPDHRAVALVGCGAPGLPALARLLAALPEDAPGVIVAAHLPAAYAAPLARWLRARCALQVDAARGGDAVFPGRVLIAPADRHVVLGGVAGESLVLTHEGSAGAHHLPSADVLLRSAARVAGAHGVGVLLAGEGDDGVLGLAALQAAGGRAAVLEPRACPIADMPRAALAGETPPAALALPQLARLLCAAPD